MEPGLDIELRDVSVRRGDRWVLRDVSLRLRAGEHWALIGGNGAGKTQLLKLLGTDVWPTPNGRGARAYRAGLQSVDVMAAKRRIAYVGAELQDKYARYGWNPTVHELLATGLHRTDLLHRAIAPGERRRITAMQDACGLGPLRRRRLLSLSYGQKRLALVARAMIAEPDWLLLDEFYNGLDADYRQRIDALLHQARVAGRSWIAAAHRGADVPRGTSGLIELRAGRVHAIGRLRPTHLDDMARQAAESPRRRVRRKPARMGTGDGRPLLQIRAADLYVDYRPVLAGMNWDLCAGEQWAVFGANGAGKSSFLKLLYGDLSPALGGRIERAGFPNGTPIGAWKRRVGYVSPELQTEYAINVSVLELVASGCHASIGLCDPPTSPELKAARAQLAFFRLATFARRRAAELSYGQLRRALIARALVADARILLLDEPLTGLDPRQRAILKGLLERLIRRGVTLVIAAHHARDLPRGMTHALFLHKRRLRTESARLER